MHSLVLLAAGMSQSRGCEDVSGCGACSHLMLWASALERGMPGVAARSLVISADVPRRGWCCKRLYVAIWPRRDGDMRSSEPISAELERILNQQWAAEHLLRSEALRS